MLSYILKRVIMMGVTLFGVSLILFLIISMMPGRPSGSAGSAEAMESSTGAAMSTDFERKWRANYHLDKPVILNRRSWMKRSVVDALIDQRVNGITEFDRNTGVEPNTAEQAVNKMRAEYALDDLGQQGVRFLLEIAGDDSVDVSLRAMAIKRLAVNAERFKRVKSPNWKAGDSKLEANTKYNAEVARERAITRRHSLKGISLDDPKLTSLINEEVQWWTAYCAERHVRYDAPEGVNALWVMITDTRYGHYVRGLLTGDLGESMKKTRVIDEIRERLPLTLTFNAISFFFIYLLALPIGIYAAVKRGQLFDVSSTVVLFMLYSLPVFYVGLMMVRELTGEDALLWFSFPVGDWDSGESYEQMTTWGRFWDRAEHSVLPLICMVYGALAGLSRFARTGLLDIIESDYIRTARAKGLSEQIVILKHALRNGALPVLTLLGTLLPRLFGGSVIVEYIFNLRGMGGLLLEAISAQDYLVMSGIVMTTSVLVVIGMFVVDLLYTVIDPRITFD